MDIITNLMLLHLKFEAISELSVICLTWVFVVSCQRSDPYFTKKRKRSVSCTKAL